jgi:hypothetical protein
MSYTADLRAALRQLGFFYVAQILKDAKPCDLSAAGPPITRIPH